MELHSYVDQIRTHLTAAAALGDERAKQTADVLAAAAEPAVRLAVLGAVSAATSEITAALLDAPGAPAVSVRLDGDELRIDVRTAEATEPPAATAEEADTSARISLRLSESLKVDIEAAARADSVSVNAWLIRAAARALQPARGPRGGGFEARGAGGHRITGWVNG
jgi:hypothetical protein